MTPDDLMTLHLVDGLPTTLDGRELRYRTVRLRETNVADERQAQRLSERVVMVGGVPKLMASDADFRFALTMLHVDAFEADGLLPRLGRELIDAALMGKLSSHDLGLIEQRVFLIELAAEVRYGNMSQADFDAIVAGQHKGPALPQAPQPVGQADGLGAAAAVPESGPALLADYARNPATRAAAGHGH